MQNLEKYVLLSPLAYLQRFHLQTGFESEKASYFKGVAGLVGFGYTHSHVYSSMHYSLMSVLQGWKGSVVEPEPEPQEP